MTGAILSAVSGLESSINELYLEAQDRGQNSLAGLTPTNVSMLAEWWQELDRRPTVLKYQMALLICGKEKFSQQSEVYRDADSVLRLRNALVHYKPEWDTDLRV
ncbi:MAG: hypothetical protein ABFD77_08605, partial [Thermotogota bacterium]